jgi:flagellar FliL protein
MAQEDDLDLDMEGVPDAPKSKSKLLIIALVVTVLLAVSATATLMLTGMLSGEDQAAAAADNHSGGKPDKKGKDKSAKKTKPPLNYIPLDPPFVVNFTGDTDIRFLQVTVEVGTRNPEAVESVKEQRPAIRNSLVMLFSSQDPYVLNTREGKEKLRTETLSEIQKVMKEETGDPGVESVFFTSFVMQ